MDVKEEMKKAFKKLETVERVRGGYGESRIETDYPAPIKRQFIIYENFGMSLEESYFWMKDMLIDAGFGDFDKITDTFTASEQSGLFGSAQQRLGIQQDKAASYLALIGRMVKEMFQIVRDIRLLEERENMYQQAAKGDDGAEKALKGAWVDFIDNGPQGLRASSVYGMASQLGYTVLPDLFFAAKPNLKREQVTDYV
ncbi:MAG TPA: hypothetical protein VKE88_02255, partial [Candidatus Nanoarchaeia archaeon]|nr:hypothetical protein [Candidatus Nanoarchaeia archaeon]